MKELTLLFSFVLLVNTLFAQNVKSAGPVNTKELNGVWVCADLVQVLTSDDFSNAEKSIGPDRCIVFMTEKSGLVCYFEPSYERIIKIPNDHLKMTATNDSITKISLPKGCNDKPFHLEYHSLSKSLTMTVGERHYEYVKVPCEVVITDPLSPVYNYFLMNGNYDIRDSSGNLLFKDVYLQGFKIQNFSNYRFLDFGDLEYTLFDGKGNAYPHLILTASKNNVDAYTPLIYRREKGKIYLYSYKFIRNETGPQIDSMRLQ